MYAIIENGSKQYKVAVGDIVKLEKLDAEVGANVEFDVVFVADGKSVKVGKDAKAFKVTGEIVAQDKAKKIIVFKYKSKKNIRKKQGHRQPFTAVKITDIVKGE
jgi:large subunit ribosomal protein L21